MKAYEHTMGLLGSLKLKGIREHIDEIIQDAERQKHSYITFLNSLLNAEIDYRAKKRFERNMSGAHFPVMKITLL